MAGHRGSSHLCKRTAASGAAVGACALVLMVAALAQEAPAPGSPAAPPDANPPAAPVPNPAFRPGLIDAVGRWFEEGADKFKSGIKDAQEKLDAMGSKARDAAKDATGSVMSVPNAKPISARERCAPAPNGAPDCQTAAATLCRGKGFQTGKIIDTQSEQKCPARFLLEGRAPNATDCPTETFVTRAMCQ